VPDLRVAYVTSGAAGMFCGSCMRDNTLVAAVRRLGCDALLVPTFTPIRTDEPQVAEERVFLGGINVYLEQRWPMLRRLPQPLRRARSTASWSSAGTTAISWRRCSTCPRIGSGSCRWGSPTRSRSGSERGGERTA